MTQEAREQAVGERLALMFKIARQEGTLMRFADGRADAKECLDVLHGLGYRLSPKLELITIKKVPQTIFKNGEPTLRDKVCYLAGFKDGSEAQLAADQKANEGVK